MSRHEWDEIGEDETTRALRDALDEEGRKVTVNDRFDELWDRRERRWNPRILVAAVLVVALAVAGISALVLRNGGSATPEVAAPPSSVPESVTTPTTPATSAPASTAPATTSAAPAPGTSAAPASGATTRPAGTTTTTVPSAPPAAGVMKAQQAAFASPSGLMWCRMSPDGVTCILTANPVWATKVTDCPAAGDDPTTWDQSYGGIYLTPGEGATVGCNAQGSDALVAGTAEGAQYQQWAAASRQRITSGMMTAPVLGYGESLQTGGLTCSMAEAGLTCSQSGSSFSLSREQLTLTNGSANRTW